jgi:hypothetical protein
MRQYQACMAPLIVRWHLRVPSKSHPGEAHEVAGWFREGHGDAVCPCKAFQFRHRCSHLTVTREECGWAALLGAEVQSWEQRHEHVCPRCGGATEWRAFLPETPDDGSTPAPDATRGDG